MRVRCAISTGTEENDNGIDVECTYAECGECGHTTMSFGTSEASVKRCLVLLREECPEGADNFYVED
ncbi:MAG TPA: hypothetical protein VFY93_02755 [Planctomycetota bacterium]|nr:hypothetical protein [Planctomycetota bacterium]